MGRVKRTRMRNVIVMMTDAGGVTIVTGGGTVMTAGIAGMVTDRGNSNNLNKLLKIARS